MTAPVPAASDDTYDRLDALYEAALDARAYVQAAAHTQLRPRRRRLREDAPLVLERLDAALADAQEVLP